MAQGLIDNVPHKDGPRGFTALRKVHKANMDRYYRTGIIRTGTLALAFLLTLIIALVIVALFGSGCAGGNSSYSPGLPVVTTHASTFDVSSLSGSFAVKNEGIAIIYVLTFDGKGGMTGVFTSQADTFICQGKVVGSYSIDSNGMGTATWNVPGVDGCLSATQSLQLAIMSGGNSFFYTGLYNSTFIVGQGIRQ